MPRNKYRLFPTTAGEDPAGPKVTKKIVKPAPAPKPAPKPKSKEGVFSVKKARKTIKGRKESMRDILKELD